MVRYLFFLVISFSLIVTQSELSERYTTFSEIESQLQVWDQEFGANQDPYNYPGEEGIIFHYEVIGYSGVDQLPIYAVKLSFNADQDLDKPKVLILGQCHAEEIYGVEISMSLIDRLLYPMNFPSQYQSIYTIMQNTEIWIIPTYNPEGLEVVHGWYENDVWSQDVYYRKNKFDVNGNGVFDYVIGPGDDVDGVDLNRNYDLHWFFGDDVDVADGGSCNPSYITNFDYYRGAAPFSEPEVQAIRDFVLDKNFLLSIAYHSSRSGCVAEKVIYPWEWHETKASPDYSIISRLGIEIASLLPKEVEAGTYYPVGSQSRKGNAHDWTYLNTGCIQYLIEVGSENMQPDDVDLIEATIDNNIEGAMWLLKRAAGTNIQGGPDLYQITGIVSDANTGSTVKCEVRIDELHGSMLKPRMTDQFGRYRRLLVEGTYTMHFEAFGYAPHSYSFVPSSGQITQYDVALIPLDVYDMNLEFEFPVHFDEDMTVVVEGFQYSDTTVVAAGEYSNEESINLNYTLPIGSYEVSVFSANLYPEIMMVDIVDNNIQSNFDLQWRSVAFFDDFNNLDFWQNSTDWTIDNGILLSNYDLVYGNLRDFSTSTTIELDSSVTEFMFDIYSKHEFEWDYDYASLSIDMEQSENEIFRFTHHDWHWRHHYVPLDLVFGRNQMTVNLSFFSDGNLNYRGLNIDNIRLLYKNLNEDCSIGDVTQDGLINIMDVMEMASVALDNSSINGFVWCVADIGEDGVINVVDIISVINLILVNE